MITHESKTVRRRICRGLRRVYPVGAGWQHHRHSARPGKANDRAAGIVDRKPWHVSVCGRKMDAERSRGPHRRRRTRHDLPPAPVLKRGPDASVRFRPGIVHASFRKLDNRAIGRRLPGRTAIDDHTAARVTGGGVVPQRHSQQRKHYGSCPRVRHRRTRDSSHGGHPKSVFELVVRKIGTEAARKTRLPFFLYGSLPAPFID